jgi:N utilization substance protein A
MNGELVRLIDSIHREKSIDKEILFEGIESALASAAKKHFALDDDVVVTIDRSTGDITAVEGDIEIDPISLGRIAAQTAKQIMIQKIKEAERDVIYDDFITRKGHLVNGQVMRYEGSTLIVNLGRTEGIMPKYEQIPGEVYHPGDRIRAFVLDVKKAGPRVKVILTRSHPEIVRRLFEIEVPEIADHTVEIKVLAREAGHRTKVAVVSLDPRVDCTGACVGVRGSRIKAIIDELGGEKIDIVRWNESAEVLIVQALKPAQISSVELDYDHKRAVVVVEEDQLSLAIGRKGQNVRLASKLSGWDIDITTPRRAAISEAVSLKKLETIPGVEPDTAGQLYEFGYRSFADLAGAELESLAEALEMDPDKVAPILEYAVEHRDEDETMSAEFAAELEAELGPGPEETRPASARESMEALFKGLDKDETPAGDEAPADEAAPEPQETVDNDPGVSAEELFAGIDSNTSDETAQADDSKTGGTEAAAPDEAPNEGLIADEPAADKHDEAPETGSDPAGGAKPAGPGG